MTYQEDYSANLDESNRRSQQANRELSDRNIGACPPLRVSRHERRCHSVSTYVGVRDI